MRLNLRKAVSGVAASAVISATFSLLAAPPASAVGDRAGLVVVVSTNGMRLTSGGSATDFSLKLPVGASCTKDSANDNYRVQSYMVPATVDPATLTFTSVGPAGGRPLYDNGGTPYVNAQTANAVTPGGPGQVINIPTFNYSVFEPGQIAPGTYNIGIACTSSPTVVDKFWNVQKTFTANAADIPAGVTWKVVARAAAADFDGNRSTDRSVFRNGAWYVQGKPTVFFGLSGDIPVPGDYDGNGTTDLAVFRDGAWFVQGQPTVFFGLSGDIPVPGDYDGNGTTDRAVFRGDGAWFVQGQPTVFLGLSGDIPQPGDYDGNGTTDRAVFRGGAWFVEGQPTVFFGLSGDIPLPLPQAIYRRFF